MKFILDLHFNPGEGMAHLQLAAKGLSILCCWAWLSHETEEIEERELALNATEQMRMFDDYLKYGKCATRHPTSNYWELKLNIAMFMALVWVLLLGTNLPDSPQFCPTNHFSMTHLVRPVTPLSPPPLTSLVPGTILSPSALTWADQVKIPIATKK
jgi:hypothetical protein